MNLTWTSFRTKCHTLAKTYSMGVYDGIYGVPSGGSFVAACISDFSKIPLLDSPRVGCLVVDDLIDSGETMRKYSRYDCAALFSKPHSPSIGVKVLEQIDEWVVFPWEVDHPGASANGPTDAVMRLLEFLGQDPKRDGLKDTPSRVVRALKEMTCGYQENPKEILSRVFEEAFDEVVVVRGIPFTSLCEHHMLPFTGTADIGYLPNGKVVGLSKLARLVDCFSKRLQIQERLTREIAEAIKEYLLPRGVGVVVTAEHSCLACRGVKKPGVEMVTSMMLGIFREKPEARAELLSLFR